jgi:hypothetical protein
MKVSSLQLTLLFVLFCFGVTSLPSHWVGWLDSGYLIAEVALLVLLLLLVRWRNVSTKVAVLHGLLFWVLTTALSMWARLPWKEVDSLLAGAITVLIFTVIAMAIWAAVTVVALLILRYGFRKDTHSAS